MNGRNRRIRQQASPVGIVQCCHYTKFESEGDALSLRLWYRASV
ncbi:hypothetical protein QWZ13_17195 [Reinekea marina]|nr:hypothetical protein [Reinekea marina]MDN3650644.1 hypothetical protein [Reinekea marina]